jgi:hypothetical protein
MHSIKLLQIKHTSPSQVLACMSDQKITYMKDASINISITKYPIACHYQLITKYLLEVCPIGNINIDIFMVNVYSPY